MLPLAIKQEEIFTFNLEVPYYNWFYPLQHSDERRLIPLQHYCFSLDRVKAAYVHFPFCHSLCSFCPYIRTHIHDAELRNRYVQLLITEILSYRGRTKPEIDCVFFGGGSPSLLSPDNFADIMDALRTVFTISPDCEITIEANAKTLSPGLFSAFRAFNVSTVRIGVQSFDQRSRELYQLSATVADIVSSVELARGQGIQVSFDLLFGHHGQSLQSFIRDIERADLLKPDTVEIYHLNLLSAPDRYWRSVSGARLPRLSARERIRYFKAGQDRLRELGYRQWSGHGFARSPDFDLLYHRCVYGTLGGYLGFGPGAISWDMDVIKWNHPGIERYMTDMGRQSAPTFKARRTSDHERLAKRFVTELPYYGYCESSDEFLVPEISEHFSELVQAGVILKQGTGWAISNTARLQYASVMFYLLPASEREELGYEIFSRCTRLGEKFTADMLWL